MIRYHVTAFTQDREYIVVRIAARNDNQAVIAARMRAKVFGDVLIGIERTGWRKLLL